MRPLVPGKRPAPACSSFVQIFSRISAFVILEPRGGAVVGRTATIGLVGSQLSGAYAGRQAPREHEEPRVRHHTMIGTDAAATHGPVTQQGLERAHARE